MYKYVLPYLLLIITACSTSTKKPITQVVEESTFLIPDVHVLKSENNLLFGKDGLVELDEALFSGYLEAYYSNGQLKQKQGYLDGRAEGEFVQNDSLGQRVERRFYLSGDKHGNHMGWYSNGQKRFDFLFDHGRSEGCHRRWRENGNLWQEFNFVNGSHRGLQRVWRSDGKLRANYVVRENGRRYGMQGIKRCKNIDTKNEQLSALTPKSK